MSDNAITQLDKPLHVRVAAALGEEAKLVTHYDGRAEWVNVHSGRPVTPYDTDWSATGPLIERYGIELLYVPANKTPPRYSESDGSLVFEGSDLPAMWVAEWNQERESSEMAPTPLAAVCHLVIALKQAGKL